jgi:hypothetical protein
VRVFVDGALIILTATLPLVDFRFRVGPVAAYDIATIMLWIAILCSARMFKKQRIGLFRKATLPLLGMIIGGGFASVVGSSVPCVDVRLAELLKIFLGMLLYLGVWVSVADDPEKRLSLITKTLIAVGFCEGVMALLSVTHMARFKGTFTDPNYFASFQSAILCLCFSLVLSGLDGRSSGVLRIINIVWGIMCVAIVGTSVALSFSRGAYIASIAGIGTMICSFFRGKTVSIFFICAVGFLIVYIGIPLFREVPGYQIWGARLSVDAMIATGGAGRVDIWGSALRAIAANPLGYGWGTEKDIIGSVSHNVILETAIQCGAIGLVALIHLMLATLGDVKRISQSQASSLMVGFAGMAISTMMSSMFLNSLYSRQFWYCMAVVSGAASAIKRRT